MNLHIVHFLISIKNAAVLKKEVISIKYNKSILPILAPLYTYNIIQSFKVNKKIKIITVKLNFYFNKILLSNLKFMTTNSKHRIYKYFDLCKFINKNRFLLITTSVLGLTNDFMCKKKKLGGKLLITC